jgi:hypothetical protein
MSPRRNAGFLGAALAFLGAAGCENDVTYSYVAVKVTVADAATPYYLGRVKTCGVNVLVGQEIIDFAPLTCAAPATSKEIGTFEWSTSSTGTVNFIVTINDASGLSGTGDSGPVTIVPGGTTTATVVVNPDPKKLEPPM